MDFLNYKDYRRYLILNLIHSQGPVSRTRLADITDYRPAAIGEIISELMEERLLVESGSASVGQGRHRTLLDLNSDYMCAIGISVSSFAVISNVLTIDGSVLASVTQRIADFDSAAHLLEETIETVRKLIAAHPDRAVIGIGICDPGQAPGVLELGTAFSFSIKQFNNWVKCDLKSAIERAVKVPVEVLGRGMLVSVAEEKFGAARGMKDFICLDLCNGVGMSFYCNGSVVGGATGWAGQIGHTRVHDSTRVCYCGKPGCMEEEIVFPTIKKHILAELSRGTASVLQSIYDPAQDLTVEQVRTALDRRDRLCCHFVGQAARLLGIATANAVNLLDPECVIFHGYMVGLGDYFTNTLQEATWENTLGFIDRVQIKFLDSTLEDTLPMGAAAVMFNRFLKTDDFKWVYNLEMESPSA